MVEGRRRGSEKCDESGTQREKREKALSSFKGKVEKGERARIQSVKPAFPSLRKE